MSEETSVAEKQVVLFELSGEIYGLDIAAVHEIIQMQPVTKVPKAPVYVEGVINLRGKVIPVVDLGKKFGMEKVGQGKNNRIVVVNIQGTTIGIIVDAVTEVLRLPESAVEPVSEIVTNNYLKYLQGIAKVDDKMIILLALDKLLSKDSALTNVAAGANGDTISFAGVK